MDAIPKIVVRLTEQLEKKGMSKAEAHDVAVKHLQKSGVLHLGSMLLTDRGVVRDNMTAAERAKDRASKASGGHKPAAYTYNQMNNVAHLKKPPHTGVSPKKR